MIHLLIITLIAVACIAKLVALGVPFSVICLAFIAGDCLMSIFRVGFNLVILSLEEKTQAYQYEERNSHYHQPKKYKPAPGETIIKVIPA